MTASSVSVAAKLSVLSLLAHVSLLSACVGEVEPVTKEAHSATGTSRDGGARDASKARDARAAEEEEEPEEEEPLEGEEGEQQPVDEPDARTSGRDAGRDAIVDANRPATRDADAPTGTDCGADGPLAKGLKVRELALYQTVKVPLYEGGAWVDHDDVPIVAGKKTLLRVFVDTMSGYSRHVVRAVLTLKSASGETVLRDERTIATNSTDADESSTFGFAIEPSQIEADTQISVSLEEPDCGAEGGSANDTRIPATGTRALGAEAIGKLKVVVLPIDIGGRLPKTDEAELSKIRAALLAYYPVAEVELTVRATPFKGPSTLAGSDNNGWSTVLNSVMRERANDRAASDVYYFGLVQPAATFATFCGRGCILGIAPQTNRVSASAQAGLGAYFGDLQSNETIVHELGHAHGRGHAPCAKGGSIQGVDGSFPESSGGIMDWGWDSRSSKLISPTMYKDVMGYCSPNWISPYTYAALATRSKAVNSLAYVHSAEAATPWQNVLLYSDGSARWGGVLETSMPGGELESADVLDANGQKLATIEVVRLALSHSDDTILYLPSPGARWASVQLHDRTVKLSQVLPAL